MAFGRWTGVHIRPKLKVGYMGFKAVSPLWKVVLPRTDESSLTSLLGFYIESFPPSGIVITGKKNKNIKLKQLNKNQ